MAHEWEQYEDRYRAERPDTFAAYVEVWRDHSEVSGQFADWETFSRCANAEAAMTSDVPDQVQLAEQTMERAGYVKGTPTAAGARQWWRSPAVRARIHLFVGWGDCPVADPREIPGDAADSPIPHSYRQMIPGASKAPLGPAAGVVSVRRSCRSGPTWRRYGDANGKKSQRGSAP